VTSNNKKLKMAADLVHVVLHCPSSLVGRLIGKRGLTIKGVQIFTRAAIDVNQRLDPAVIAIFGPTSSTQMAASMIGDIVNGVFKGFGNLRQIALAHGSRPLSCASAISEAFAYAPGIGLLPRQQLYTPGSALGGAGVQGGRCAASALADPLAGSAWSSSAGGGSFVAPSTTMACTLAAVSTRDNGDCNWQAFGNNIATPSARAQVRVTCFLPQDTTGAIKVSGILE
jgi:KH domain